MKIYLASKSPRRNELLQQIGVDFEILSLDVPEDRAPDETPEQYSERITGEKLQGAWDYIIENNLPIMPVLCADTEVVSGEDILGKPRDYQHAFSMLKRYSGDRHQVITSVGLKYFTHQKIITNETTVFFAPISDDEIHNYLETGDYKDKAGGYGIQGFIGQFIFRVEGCFYSVMGLPLNTVRELLKALENIPGK